MIFKAFLFFVLVNPLCALDSPYLLPEHHEIKPILDSIFTQSRATLSPETLLEAGFITCEPRKYTHVIVTTHPDVPGWVFKLYLDSQVRHTKKSEAQHWNDRAEGAEIISQIIESYGFQSLFKIPKKWIYVLPEYPKASKGYIEKESILVEEDMQILPKKENLKKWKSSEVSRELLSALYIILKEAGLSDCLKPANIPFSIDGKVAFVDTEIHGDTKIKYKELKSYLSEENKAFWAKLTN